MGDFVAARAADRQHYVHAILFSHIKPSGIHGAYFIQR